jgi:hypothetical protein
LPKELLDIRERSRWIALQLEQDAVDDVVGRRVLDAVVQAVGVLVGRLEPANVIVGVLR